MSIIFSKLWKEQGPFAIDLFEKGYNCLNITKILNEKRETESTITYGQVKGFIGRYKENKERILLALEIPLSKYNIEPKVDDISTPEIERLKESNQRLILANANLTKKLLNKQAGIDTLVQAMLIQIDKMKFYPLSRNELSKPIKSKRNLTMEQLLSDIHWGEKVDSIETMGLGHYDAAEAERRMNKLRDKVIQFKREDEESHGLNHLVLYMVGDIVEGTGTFAKQIWNVDLNELEQIFSAADYLGSMIRYYRTIFQSVTVYCIPGNHRNNPKNDQSHWSWVPDYLVYETLKRSVSNLQNVDVFISSSPKMVVQRGSKIVVLGHGNDAIRYQGVPYYGIDRVFRRLPNLFGIIPDYFLIGHFHEASDLRGEVIINGCVPGGSDLAITKLNITSRAEQKVWYFDDEHGINRMINVYLSDKVVLEKDEHNIYTPHDRLLKDYK